MMQRGIIPNTGHPKVYGFTGELGTKIAPFAGIFYEYELNNTFPGWKGASAPADIRAVHFFNLASNELLVGIDTNNVPTVPHSSNSTPTCTSPFFASPEPFAG